MITKVPPEVLTTQKKLFMSQLDEYHRRQYLGTEALALGRRSVDKVTQFFSVSKTTVYNSINEIKSGYAPEPGRIRRPGGGRVWREHLREQDPDAHTLVILCDGGGSNSSSHRIVKQDLMNLADRLGIRLLVVHYPPYSMHNYFVKTGRTGCPW